MNSFSSVEFQDIVWSAATENNLNSPGCYPYDLSIILMNSNSNEFFQDLKSPLLSE